MFAQGSSISQFFSSQQGVQGQIGLQPWDPDTGVALEHQDVKWEGDGGGGGGGGGGGDGGGGGGLFALNEQDLDRGAAEHGWQKLATDLRAQMASYTLPNPDPAANGAVTRLNFWMTTGTVGSYLQHPVQGKTHLFRRKLAPGEAGALFEDPRAHTGAGYHTRDEIFDEDDEGGGGGDGAKRKRGLDDDDDGGGAFHDAEEDVDPSDDADAIAYISANHRAWVDWLDCLALESMQQLGVPTLPDGYTPMHDPARHPPASRHAFWVESGSPPSTEVARARKRRRRDDCEHGDGGDPRVVEMVRYDRPYPCAFFQQRGFCDFRATCSYAHGELRTCLCTDTEDCPKGHPRRAKPQPCAHGAWDVCRWHAKAECAFHHGEAEACGCTSARCLKGHPTRTKRHKGSVNKTCFACGQIGHTAEHCLRTRVAAVAKQKANKALCSRCGGGDHKVHGCRFPKKSKEAKKLKKKRAAGRRKGGEGALAICTRCCVR